MRRLVLTASLSLLLPLTAFADPTVVSTQKLCGLVGEGIPKVPGQASVGFYGTDLGYTYKRGSSIEILFGDTWRNENGDPIDPNAPRDDAFGTISLTQFPTGQSVVTACSQPTPPAFVTLATLPGTNVSAPLNPGVPQELGKTPVAAFTTGNSATAQEFAIFHTSKPWGCLTNTNCQNNMVCDPGLGFAFEEYFDPNGVTIACVDNTPGCLNDTMANAFGFPIPGTGFCVDPTSASNQPAGSDNGRISSVVVRHRIGSRKSNRRDYASQAAQEWHTNRFLNMIATPVNNFAENRVGTLNDYTPPDGTVNTSAEKVLMWGRPNYAGVGAIGRQARLYFAYADRPQADASGNFTFNRRYFKGLNAAGQPTFSSNEREAVPLLNGATPDESSDYVGQMSIHFFPELAGGGRAGRWVMFYSGGESTLPQPLFGLFSCGYLEFLVGLDCGLVNQGNRSVKMRWANDPWGPWSSPPQDVLVGGFPGNVSILPNQYGPGGVLRHPTCTGPGCAPHSSASIYSPTQEYGVLYGVNIITPWKVPTANGVDVIWNVSSWDPYNVWLFKTTINK